MPILVTRFCETADIVMIASVNVRYAAPVFSAE